MLNNWLNINTESLRCNDVKLTLFQEADIPLLCQSAQDKRIWIHHQKNFHQPDAFISVFMAKAKCSMTERKRVMFVIHYQNNVIGSTSFYDIISNHLSIKMGYTWIHPDYWGLGINKIVKQLMFKVAFEQLNFRRVSLTIDSENIHARRAIESLGIPFEGIMKKHLVRPDGSARDSALYAITDDFWRSKFQVDEV